MLWVTLLSLLKKLRSTLTHSYLILLSFFIVALIFLGTVVYSLSEGWSWLDSLYVTIITITTVGYGDLTPQTTIGRMFAIVFTLGAIGIGGYALTEMAALVFERQSTRRERLLRRRRMDAIKALHDHIIVCGVDSVGMHVAKEYQRTNQPFIIIEPDEATLKQTLLFLHEEYHQRRIVANLWDFADHDGDEELLSVSELANETGVLYYLDDPRNDEVLMRAQIQTARGLVTSLPDDRDNLFIVVGARALSQQLDNPQLRIMTRAQNITNVRKLYVAGADHVRMPDVFGGYQMATAVLNPQIAEFLDRTLFMQGGEDLLRFRDIVLADHPLLIGRSIAQMKEQFNQLVIGIMRDNEYMYTPDANITLQEGDTAFVFGPELKEDLNKS